MLMPFHPPPPLAPTAEQGFSLIELLVAMLSSIVVLFTLYAIFNFTLNQETRITEVVQADQVGRTAMSKIIEELHSSCTGATPIQEPSGTLTSPLEKSGARSMWFYSAYGDTESGAATLPEVTEHDIVWTSNETSNTGEELGTLTDYAFKSESTSKFPEWKFLPLKTSNAAKTTILAKDVIPNKINGEATIFQYYKYKSGELVTAKPSTSAAEAEDVAKVTIGFSQASTGGLGSTSGDTRSGRATSFGDSVVLRLDPTATGSEGSCE
jgi:type II secretory pathway pseudopilin PulG